MKHPLSKTARVLCAVLAVLGVFFFLFGMAVILWIYPFEAAGSFGTGLILALLHSMLKVVLMERTLNRAADMGENSNAGSYGAAQTVLRSFLTLGLFLLVFFFPNVVGMYGAIIGVLSLQIAGYITGYLLRKESTEV